MTEQERLLDRLFNSPERKLLNFNIYPGDGKFTSEELCAQINSAMDQIEDGRAIEVDPDTGKPVHSGRPKVNIRERKS